MKGRSRNPSMTPSDFAPRPSKEVAPPPLRRASVTQIDDQEADLDAASVKEFDRMESLRRMEIKRGLALAARDRCRAVRREKMRWAVSRCIQQPAPRRACPRSVLSESVFVGSGYSLLLCGLDRHRFLPFSRHRKCESLLRHATRSGTRSERKAREFV